MSREEILFLIDRYLNETGQFYGFASWLEAQGYTLEELGFSE